MKQKFIIPGRLPDFNQVIGLAKSHYMAYSTMKAENTEAVAWCCKSLKPMERVRVSITWYCENKRQDPDNVIGGGQKFVLDGLVKAGVLVNDGWKQIASINNKMAVDRDKPRIEVELEEELKG